MSRTNQTRHIKWHETCKYKCRLNAIVYNNKQRWNKNKCRCECKELIDKGVCDKGFIWNPSNCECECDKACDIGEYLDYENCKCKKRLINKLVDECTETENENSYKCIPRTVYIVLFSVYLCYFTINVGRIVTYYVYSQWYLKKRFTTC